MALTDAAYWDSYWDSVTLPREHRHAPGNLYLNEILSVFDRFLPRRPGLRALEVGGAPGQYLAYLHRAFGYEVHCLDYSERGCEATRRNFELLGIPGQVHHGDVFSDDLVLPEFDVVYSLGLIEHFSDPKPMVARHVRSLREGGHLILGVPNFKGVNGWFLRRLAPSVYAQHEVQVMDIATWGEFESEHGLVPLFKGYVGGFEPGVFLRREVAALRNLVPHLVARGLHKALHGNFPWLRRINGPRISGYAMAVYRR